MVEVLLMVFWLFSYEQRHNRFAEIAQSCGNLVTYFFCRWFGNDDDHFHCIVVLHSVDHVHHGNPTYRGVQVSSSDTNGICHTLAHTVDDRCQFLDSCPRCPDNTNGARSYIICKCNRNTLNDPRTTVRSHHSQSLFVRLLFQLHFVFQCHIITEHEDIHTLVQGTIRLQGSICARDGDDGQIGVRKLLKRLIPGFHTFGALFLAALGRLLTEKLFCLLHNCIQKRIIVNIRDNNHVVCGSCHQLFSIKPTLFENVFVSRRCHHNRNFFDTFDCRNLVCQKH